MSNPFMAALGGGQMPMGNFAQMVQQFNQFKANLTSLFPHSWKSRAAAA